MKTTKKILSLVLALSLVLSMFMTRNSDAKAKIKLNKKKITMTVGQKYKLKLKNYKKKVKWKSSKKSTATVNKNGVVTAKKKGSAKITALAGKKKYVCKVTVKARKITPANTPSIASSVPVVVPTEKSGVSQTVTPSIAPSSTPSTPSIAPSSTPSTEPTTTPSNAPTVIPSTVPSIAPTTTPSMVPTSTPTAEPTVEPTQMPTTTPSATPEMEDVPKFITFKTYDDEEVFVDESEMLTQELDDQLLVASAASETAETETKSIENNWINKEDILLLKLSYENKRRDSIVEIVINDSDYGKKQIYTTAASVNKILSSDTYYDEEKDSYVTDVLLQMPVTKSSEERNIEIQETCFLRETIGKKGYADMSSARRTAVKFNVSQEPLPSYPIYFNFTKNETGGYTVVSWNQNYTLPDTLYIPSTYKGKPVNQISSGAFERAVIKKLIIPESISQIDNNMTGMSGAVMLNSIVMLGRPPYLGSFSLTIEQLNGGCKIYVPYKYVFLYKNRNGDGWVGYLKNMYYEDTDGTIKSVSEYEETGKELDNIVDRNDDNIATSDDVIAVSVCSVESGGYEDKVCSISDEGIQTPLGGSMTKIDLQNYINKNGIRKSDYNGIQITYQAFNEDGSKADDISWGKICLVTKEDLDGYSNGLVTKYMENEEKYQATKLIDYWMAKVDGINFQVGFGSKNQYIIISEIYLFKYK